ncbi:alkylphosphonate uptake protein PhnA (plasmid) [Legionella adelaidensis]|uniref:Alkylphosphonate uptake protein PhnA n=1 Tax=Legionella adelaidensis TaxID=45056 RepID=A0A0W0R2I4_9GAMM|nr:zinc ribbon domain-containing protein YjdM [Legionella adelaidensis]KTC65312.1 alkylphosphonate uptake protein PhnA [Legionella adelaidensis]VEH86037.1 alkylphosphonate uptake protein PhnA [Legionella adelaidensis]
MTDQPACPKCNSPYTYTDGTLLICSQCAHEWTPQEENVESNALEVVKDAHGTVLNDGDTITVIKDLKIKGSSQVVKVGTKVRNIRLLPAEDHNIDCKIDGIGAMKLKSEFVKKV